MLMLYNNKNKIKKYDKKNVSNQSQKFIFFMGLSISKAINDSLSIHLIITV